jgi:uncharacterized membrane protein
VASCQLPVTAGSRSGATPSSWYAVVAFALAAAAIAGPWLRANAPEIGYALQRGFSLVCHQQPERSFMLFGGSVAVCARCLGIYLGAAVGSIVRLSRQVARELLLAVLAVNAVDWLAELASLHGNWMPARFVLGFALGMGGTMLIVAQQPQATAASADGQQA